MRKLFSLWSTLLLCLAFVGCSTVETKEANYEVVPLPKEITKSGGESFKLTKSTKIAYLSDNEKLQKNADFLAEYINQMLGFKPSLTTDVAAKDAIVLGLSATGNDEGYEITVNKDQVLINGTTEAGVFYGIQTLRKSLPVAKGADVNLPAVTIKDFPRFSYRGMMLDVSRHFFPVEMIKRYIDMLALHNLNKFHWHLSEDQGWRIEIKKYPLLTEIGSKRSETVIGRNSGEYDGVPYGGFYTQEEAKEIVKYAADRFITVIPEIDLPGHMQAALAAYPELGCTGGPYEVWKQWGISEDVLCAGQDQTLEFLEGVLAEIIEIFPSTYIHIGGDECPKSRWKECAKCQAKIKELGLKADASHSAEDRLQSYIITNVEKFLNENGRQIIGWDEILEGGLAPNATVMSWRSMAGGTQAAKMGHDVVMTPTSHVYFDYYQTLDTDNEPLGIGGYVPVETVYSLEPVPSSLTPEEEKHIIGAQANLWTEYIPTFEHVEYMVLPRMAALSEVQWVAKDQKDYSSFLQRLARLIPIYNLEGYNYAKHLFDIQPEYTPNIETGALDVVLSTIDGADIYYTLDGTDPTVVASATLYTEPLHLKENGVLKAVVVRPAGNSRVLTENIVLSKSSMKPITMVKPINKQYEFKGKQTLIDGLKGTNNYRTGRWVAVYKNDLEAIIDLQEEMEISSMDISTCVMKGDWVMGARGFEVLVSEDGENFKSVAKQEYPAMKETDRDGIYDHHLEFTPVQTRYVKVIGTPEYKMPEWHGGKGNPSFLFFDEIAIN